MNASGDLKRSSPSPTETKVVSIGSDARNDICVDGILPFHARFLCESNSCVIEDLTEEKTRVVQTFVAPEENPTERIPVKGSYAAKYEDVVYLGMHPFPLSNLSNVRPANSSQGEANRAKAPSSRSALKSDGNTIRVGADASNRIVLEAPSVSAFHAEFRLGEKECWVRDSESGNGTFLLNPDAPTENLMVKSSDWTRATYGDVALLGSCQFPLSRLLEIKDIPIEPGTEVLVGRTPRNDRVLNNVSVSSNHVRFFFQPDRRVFVEDLASVSGTFLNERRLAPHSRCELAAGDRLRIACYDLYIERATKKSIRVDFSGDMKLDVQNLECTIGTKKVLQDVSFSVFPGELIGILGPSGHGKSVLLESLVHKPSGNVSGEVRINNKSLWTNWGYFRERIGYVPQGEVFPLQFSVEQLLRYAARLWIPSDLSAKEIEFRIDAVLHQMNLEHVRQSLLRVLSGGEIRRISIAYELIRCPNLLFLDEPTSGLSTKDSKIVMQALRNLANIGHTVISVIHQPSMDVYSLFNLVAVLFEGRIIYYGPPQFSNAYFRVHGTHPEEIFQALERYEIELDTHRGRREELLNEWVLQFQQSSEYEEYVAKRIASNQRVEGRAQGASRR